MVKKKKLGLDPLEEDLGWIRSTSVKTEEGEKVKIEKRKSDKTEKSKNIITEKRNNVKTEKEKMTIWLEKDLMEKLKIHAVKNRKRYSEVISELLKRELT